MHMRGMVAGSGGNISARLDDGNFLFTPTGASKGFMRPSDLIVADGAGNKLSGEGSITSEYLMHLAVYKERPDQHAVIHAHPIFATALTLAGINACEPLLPEVIMSLEGLPTAPYATPGSLEGAEAIRELIRTYDVVLLERHGILAVGTDLKDTYMKLECAEHVAQILYLAHLHTNPAPLPEEVVSILLTKNREAQRG